MNPSCGAHPFTRSLHAHRSGVAKDSLAIILQPDEKFELEDCGPPGSKDQRAQYPLIKKRTLSFQGMYNMI